MQPCRDPDIEQSIALLRDRRAGLGILGQLCHWLSRTALSDALRSNAWIVPAVQSVHIMAIAMLLSSMLLCNLPLLAAAHREEAAPLRAGSLRMVFWWALLVLLVSGALLVTAEPWRELLNRLFQVKMALLPVALALSVLLQRSSPRGPSSSRRSLRGFSVKARAITSLLLWVAIICCGRWIAYVT